MATRKGLKKVKVKVSGYTATRYKKKASTNKTDLSSRISKLKARNSYIQKTLKAKKLERIKLINKGLKSFPSSKIQKDIQKKIQAIENKIKSLEKEYRQNGILLKEIDRKRPTAGKQVKLF